MNKIDYSRYQLQWQDKCVLAVLRQSQQQGFSTVTSENQLQQLKHRMTNYDRLMMTFNADSTEWSYPEGRAVLAYIYHQLQLHMEAYDVPEHIAQAIRPVFARVCKEYRARTEIADLYA